MKRAEEMRAMFARFEESGLSLKAFGEREQVSYSMLQYWRRKLRDAEKPPRPVCDSLSLVPVRVVPDSLPVDLRPQHFEVWLANGVSVEVPTGFDECDLRRLVGVLSTC